MTEKGMVLEEYIEFIREYEYGRNPYRYCSQGKEIWVSYLNAQDQEEICLEVDDAMPRSISGNNVDGFVITAVSYTHLVAVPGHSEHETGLAIDLGLKLDVIDFIRPEFPYEGICQTFRKLAPRYGFVERYPKGKEAVTGIGQEPWHFRYVGAPHAEIMTEKGMVLEEYIEFIREYEYGRNPYRYCSQGKEIWVSYLNAQDQEEICLEVDDAMPRSISGNNVDGFVITEWRNCHGK